MFCAAGVLRELHTLEEVISEGNRKLRPSRKKGQCQGRSDECFCPSLKSSQGNTGKRPSNALVEDAAFKVNKCALEVF